MEYGALDVQEYIRKKRSEVMKKNRKEPVVVSLQETLQMLEDEKQTLEGEQNLSFRGRKLLGAFKVAIESIEESIENINQGLSLCSWESEMKKKGIIS